MEPPWRGFKLATVMGAFPFFFRDGHLLLSPLLLLYGLLLRVVFAVQCLLVILKLREMVRLRGGSDFFNGILTASTFITYFCPVVSYVWVLRKRGSLISLFRSFTAVDRMLWQMKHTRKHGSSYAFGDFVVSLTAAISILRMYGIGASVLILLSYDIFAPLNVYATVDPFLQTVAFIQNRLANLKYLLPLVRQSQRCQLLRLHNGLCNKCRMTNNIFGVQLLCLYVVIFNNVVSSCYIFCISLIVSDPPLSLACHASIVLFYGAIGWRFTKACNDTASEVKGFNNLLYQMMIEDKTKVISTERIFRLHVSMNREIVFTACGFITIDNSLLHSIIAATTTYLVVLIQFKNAIIDTKNTLFSNTTENVFFYNRTEFPIHATMV